MPIPTERRGNAAVSWLSSPKHPYEDRYRLLTRAVPLVAQSGRGEIVAVFDGISSAPKGMPAAQAMADGLLAFYRNTGQHPASSEGLRQLLQRTNQEMYDWGVVSGTKRSLGGCAGTVAWVHERQLTVFHAGDTVGMLLSPGEGPRQMTFAHEQGGALTRYFGIGDKLQIDITTMAIAEDDVLLLMSDGVTKAFSAQAAAELVATTMDRCGDPGAAAEELATQSRRRGSTDDITVVVMTLNEDE